MALRMVYREATLDVCLKHIQDDAKLPSQPSSNEGLSGEPPERMLLSKGSGKQIAEHLEIPAIEVEVERAVWQVDNAIKAQAELQEEKKHLDSTQNSPR